MHPSNGLLQLLECKAGWNRFWVPKELPDSGLRMCKAKMLIYSHNKHTYTVVSLKTPSRMMKIIIIYYIGKCPMCPGLCVSWWSAVRYERRLCDGGTVYMCTWWNILWTRERDNCELSKMVSFNVICQVTFYCDLTHSTAYPISRFFILLCWHIIIYKFVLNSSTCKGRRWECTDNDCGAKCTIYGEGNYITFDERKFAFKGACGYIFAQVSCNHVQSVTYKCQYWNTNIKCCRITVRATWMALSGSWQKASPVLPVKAFVPPISSSTWG